MLHAYIASQKRNACIMRVTLNGKEKLFQCEPVNAPPVAITTTDA
jgi:hypothetical protein